MLQVCETIEIIFGMRKNPEWYKNVEWCGDDRSTAIKISWGNWGNQIRIAPAPNLESTAFRNAQKDILNGILPVVENNYRNLLPSEKYLFGGIVWGMELSVGVNAYYYPNGNSYLNEDPKKDPGLCSVFEDSASCKTYNRGG